MRGLLLMLFNNPRVVTDEQNGDCSKAGLVRECPQLPDRCLRRADPAGHIGDLLGDVLGPLTEREPLSEVRSGQLGQGLRELRGRNLEYQVDLGYAEFALREHLLLPGNIATSG